MADYAGAVAALKAAFISGWASQTPVVYANEAPPSDPWPPSTPWAYFEVIGNGAIERSIGVPGDKLWLYSGHVFVHVFVPLGYGIEEPQRLAVAAGEIFRANTFYQNNNGAKVICQAPSTDGGASDADSGNQFRVTCAIPFEYYHRG